jgi:hypothetical protein
MKAMATHPQPRISLSFDIRTTPAALKMMKTPAAKNGRPNAAMRLRPRGFAGDRT